MMTNDDGSKVQVSGSATSSGWDLLLEWLTSTCCVSMNQCKSEGERGRGEREGERGRGREGGREGGKSVSE